ncbi:sugar ABC transporter substrate-binding protein [Amycolatopsis sp. K13G38]|uniref:Sugar ABC transporter substrate-binding protein n=1 Tax=Amycolatopsis acididurans TaxID=2724524 RepID=A0ABX1IW88_9PSEU|nr:sugar ABC transporter substrate-binding protein [Amycolatopsis acididurans]NKQ51753.1 sugar ABC transporter substrate-binding protein [Amycolatopsis acididurans]
MRITKFGVAFTAAALTLCALTACKSGSGTAATTPEGTQKAQAAQQVVDAAKAVPAADNLGAPIAVGSLRGKTIYSIPIDSKAEFYQAGEAAMKNIAAKAGVNYVTFPSDGTQTSYQQGISQAINAGAGAILLNGPLPSTLGPQIDAATKAGIPVVPLHISDKGSPVSAGVKYEAFAPFNEAARLMALAATGAQKGAPVHALVIQSSETGPSKGMVDTIQKALTDEAPAGSDATVINVAVPQWSQQIQGQVQSALLKNPNINAVLPIYDSMSLYAAPGIKQAAANRNVPVYTFNGTPSILAMVQNGQVAMDVAENPDWVAYVNLDVTFRAMLGAPPVPAESGPVRVIDSSNVADTGNPPASGKGFGDKYAGAFLQLWGLA